MSRYYDFDPMARRSKKWEKRLAPLIESFYLRAYHARIVNYDTPEDRNLQRNGVDLEISSKTAKWEAKTRSHRYYFDDKVDNAVILLETVSVVEKNIPGWVYTCKSQYIVYVWENESGTNLERWGFFINIEALQKTAFIKNLTQRYCELKPKKPSRRSYKGKWCEWYTKFVIVPIADFPEGTLFKFPSLLPFDGEQIKLGGSQ